MSSFFLYILLFGFVIISNSVFGTENKFFQNENLPRVKHLYISGSVGYLHQNKYMLFKDIDDCKGNLKPEFFCKQKSNGNYENNAIKTEYRPATTFSAAIGINSDDAIRFELSYLLLNKNLTLNGVNQDGLNYNQYTTNLKFETGSINVFLDFISKRNDAYSVFIPYIMGGFGFSGIKMDDVSFKLADGTEWNFIGNTKDNKTYTLGFGLTAGINNYISVDIGYRHYDFGNIETQKTATRKDGAAGTITTTHIGLKSKLEADNVVATLKLQI